MSKPLRILVDQYGTVESNGDNIESAIARGLPEISPAICSHDGTFVIVGSGPSLPQFVDEIKAEREKGRPICAINGAYDFLVDSGVTPDLFLTVDPRPMPQNVTKPQPETIFLLASRVNPEVFDRLKDHKVMVWHSFSFEEECKAYGKRPAIGGGSTSGLRAITVAYVMGYRRFAVYGLDSCLAGDNITKRFTGEKAGHVIDVIVGGRTFYANGAMAQQANECQELMGCMPGITIDFKGDGLIAAIWAERRKLGLTA